MNIGERISRNSPSAFSGSSRPRATLPALQSALEQARAVAGRRDIVVGAVSVAQQFLKAGLLDEIHLNIVPVLLGGGVHLFANLDDRRFELECTRVVESDGVTHVRYRVVR